MGYFEDHRSAARLLWAFPPEEGPVLRSAQLGAVWAVASHFTTERIPAEVVLPIGTGSTTVACLLPFMIPTRRVLVIASSLLAADLIAQEFTTLSALRDTDTIVGSMPAPRVLVADVSRRDWEDTDTLRRTDVTVVTVRLLTRTPNRQPVRRLGLFDLFIVDQAQQLGATLERLIGQLAAVNDGRTVLLTPMPLRVARHGAAWWTVYCLPLSQTLHARLLGPVRPTMLRLPVGADRDDLLVGQAVERLRARQQETVPSTLLVRVGRGGDASRLQQLYERAGARLAVIDHCDNPTPARPQGRRA